MRHTWTEEQNLLRESLGRAFAAPAPHEDARWRQFADLGLLGLSFEETHGGSNAGPLETAIVAEALGRGLIESNYIPGIVLAAGLVRLAGDAAQKAEHLPKIAEGRQRLAFAFSETASRFNPAYVTLAAADGAGGFVLSGRKIVVYGAPQADFLIVSARTAGDAADAAGISLFILPAGAEGISKRIYNTMDGQSAADITFNAVRAPAEALLGPRDGALGFIERALDEASVALCADLVGAMEALNARCVAHCQTREAFGKTLAHFQVLRHRLVDMRIAYEQAAALVVKASRALDGPPRERAKLASACKTQVCTESSFVAKAAVQIHGAMGITEECDIGQYFKRITLAQSMFGSSDHHLRRYLRHAAEAFAHEP
ncbi:MAG: acyl-CoA dehydrogenase [Terricaulis sp.]|nr:acyl-CoA dehydrogenase [Terricaulis sp.]